MISYKEAREMVSKEYSKVTRYKDAWWFAPPEAKNMVGGDQGRVVMKEDGKILRPYEYFLGPAVMSEEEVLMETVAECCNDIIFSYKGVQAGITSEVHEFVPTYQVWYGESTKEYSEVEEVFSDKFYDGKSIKDLIGEVEFTFV